MVVNPSISPSISIGSSVGSVGEWLRQITVRVASSPNSHGSGVVWSRDGLIVTNAHVATGQTQQVEFADGSAAAAWLVARDAKLDLAALAVRADTVHAAFARSARTLRTGELVVAVGNPWDGDGAVSTGIVHQRASNGPWIIADIRLAPGNSGGPLADAHGNVVGINSMIVNGFGVAITSDAVATFLKQTRLAVAA